MRAAFLNSLPLPRPRSTLPERVELERLQTGGLGWREAYGLTAEAADPLYVIWWRFEIAQMRIGDEFMAAPAGTAYPVRYPMAGPSDGAGQ